MNHITDAAWTAKDIAACIACYAIVAAFPAMLIAAAWMRGWSP